MPCIWPGVRSTAEIKMYSDGLEVHDGITPNSQQERILNKNQLFTTHAMTVIRCKSYPAPVYHHYFSICNCARKKLPPPEHHYYGYTFPELDSISEEVYRDIVKPKEQEFKNFRYTLIPMAEVIENVKDFMDKAQFHQEHLKDSNGCSMERMFMQNLGMALQDLERHEIECGTDVYGYLYF